MRSIKLRLVIIYLALVFIVMLLAGTFMIVRTKFQEESKARTELEKVATSIDEQIIQKMDRWDEFQTAIRGLISDTQISGSQSSRPKGSILDSSGATIATSDSETPTFNFSSSVIVAALAGNASFSPGKWSLDNNSSARNLTEYARPVFNDGGEVEYVIYTRMDTGLQSKLQEMAITVMISVVLALILTAALGVLFANTLTGPIILLTNKSKELAEGNLDQEIQTNSIDEIGQLTHSFNYMARELKKTMDNISSEKNKMEIMLYNMTDGVLAYDRDGVLLHANYSAMEFLNVNNVGQVPFAEMLDNLGIVAPDLENLKPGSLKESTLPIGDRYISSVLTPYFTKYGEIEGYIIVLQDVTKHKKLDNMRKEFVANVSHELRTPLTTVKSYTETLLDGAIDDRAVAMEFLDIIDHEADRMTFLVKDLLELSQFDNNQYGLNCENCNLCDIILQSIKQNSVLARKKNQAIYFEPSPGPMVIYADPGRINQVLSNIISNSIKYSPEGGEIKIHLETSEKYYRVYIKDNGMGIPKEDLRHIFERFYRVDKARSRAMGGTGLGLSIAKEIMEAHGGKISVTSEVDAGTTMILRFTRVHPPELELN